MMFFTKEDLNQLHKVVSDTFDSMNRYIEIRKKYKRKMEQKKYTRSELLKYIRMNKPMPNQNAAFMGIDADQITNIHIHHGGSVTASGDHLLCGNGERIVVEDGYILPYEPKDTPPFDLELEKHQYMKDQIDKVMGQYKDEIYHDPITHVTESKFKLSEYTDKKDEECIPNDGRIEDALKDLKGPQKCETGSCNPLNTTQAAYTRETFLNNLANTLHAAGIYVNVGEAEKIYKLYNLVQIYGGKVTMEQINKIKSEK